MTPALWFCFLALLLDAGATWWCNGTEVGPVGKRLGNFGCFIYQICIALLLRVFDPTGGGLVILGIASLLAVIWNLNQKYRFTTLF